MATLKEVAALAGVSSATASRVLNKDHTLSVKDSTRKAVFDAADMLDYRVKKDWKRLKFAVVQWIYSYEEEEDPYYSVMRKMVERYCSEQNISTVRFFKENINAVLVAKDIDGIIAIGKFSMDQVEEFHQACPNLIFIDSNPDEQRYSSVVSDLGVGIALALDHLEDMGHVDIGYIGGKELIGSQGKEYIDHRERTFINLMKKSKTLKYNPEAVLVGDFDAETGFEKMLESKDLSATAYICASDLIAMGALRALSNSNRYISVIGFNNNVFSKYLNPPLTTVEIDVKGMAYLGCMILKEMVEGDVKQSSVKIQLQPTLIKRESVFSKI